MKNFKLLSLVLVGVCQIDGGQLLAAAAPYTTTLVETHTAGLLSSPYVMPTLSADPNLVVGQSFGWPSSPFIPQHDLYGFKITDPNTGGQKEKIVMISGNHNTEWTGNWSLQGAIDFYISDDPRADVLRKNTELYVYPMVNPDGRFTLTGHGGNPELTSLGHTNHNQVWNETGISTIDALTAAMFADTGGAVDYMFDFHSGFSDDGFMITTPEQLDSPFSLAMSSRVPSYRIVTVPGLLSDPKVSLGWGLAELNATYVFAPEINYDDSEADAIELGQNHALGLYDVIVATIVPEPTACVLLISGAMATLFGRPRQPPESNAATRCRSSLSAGVRRWKWYAKRSGRTFSFTISFARLWSKRRPSKALSRVRSVSKGRSKHGKSFSR